MGALHSGHAALVRKASELSDEGYGQRLVRTTLEGDMQRAAVRTISAEGASAPSVVAVRAAEILEASRIKLERARPPADTGAKEPPTGAVTEGAGGAPAQKPAGPLHGGIGVEVGAVVLQGGGVGPAVGPFVRVEAGAALPGGSSGALAARVRLVGPTFAPELTGGAGTLDVRQEMAMAEAVYSLEALGPVVPRLSAGVGVYHLHAAGDPAPPYEAASGEVWAALAGAGAGLGLPLGARVAVLLDVQVLFAEPRAVVRLAGEQLGAPGRPSVGGFLGLVVKL